MIALACLGALVCLYLELLHVQTYLGLGGTGYCEAGEHVSCTSVALSGISVVLGVPLPAWGVAGFLAIGVAAWRRSSLLVWLAALAVVASLGLLAYELAVVGSICIWCEVVHLICFGLLALAWLERGAARPGLDVESVALVLGPSAALIAAVAMFAPAYWMAASWSAGARLPHGVDQDGRPWLGAEQPELVVHEYVDYACPHCRVASARMKMQLADDPGLRVVRHHQPRMRCGSEPDHAERCVHARAAICAGDQDLFWEMDDWLFHHAPGATKVDLEQAGLDVGFDLEALRACMGSDAAYARAQADVDEAREWGIRGTPGYVIDGQRLEPQQVQQYVDDHR